MVEHTTFNRGVDGFKSLHTHYYPTFVGNKLKEVNIIKNISKNEITKLLSDDVIKNTRHGYVDRKGNHVGYYRTCGGKRYIEDKYLDR